MSDKIEKGYIDETCGASGWLMREEKMLKRIRYLERKISGRIEFRWLINAHNERTLQFRVLSYGNSDSEHWENIPEVYSLESS